MKETRLIMGMPVTVEISDNAINARIPAEHGTTPTDSARAAIDAIFSYFNFVDQKFSTYKDTSEVTAFNKGLIKRADFSLEMAEIFRLAEETKVATHGFFDIKQPAKPNTSVGPGQAADFYDPSGIVKGWAILNAAKILSGKPVGKFGAEFRGAGFKNFFVDAGGDIQVSGVNSAGKPWSVGIQNPFSKKPGVTGAPSKGDGPSAPKANVVKKVYLAKNEGMATSGTYVRGQHIYNPLKTGSAGPAGSFQNQAVFDIVSLTVIGPNIYEADRFATAAFAMNKAGIQFIENLDGFEGYMIDKNGIATMTSGFEKYTSEPM